MCPKWFCWDKLQMTLKCICAALGFVCSQNRHWYLGWKTCNSTAWMNSHRTAELLRLENIQFNWICIISLEIFQSCVGSILFKNTVWDHKGSLHCPSVSGRLYSLVGTQEAKQQYMRAGLAQARTHHRFKRNPRPPYKKVGSVCAPQKTMQCMLGANSSHRLSFLYLLRYLPEMCLSSSQWTCNKSWLKQSAAISSDK